MEKWNAWVSQLATTSANTSVKVSNIEKIVIEITRRLINLFFLVKLK